MKPSSSCSVLMERKTRSAREAPTSPLREEAHHRHAHPRAARRGARPRLARRALAGGERPAKLQRHHRPQRRGEPPPPRRARCSPVTRRQPRRRMYPRRLTPPERLVRPLFAARANGEVTGAITLGGGVG